MYSIAQLFLRFIRTLIALFALSAQVQAQDIASFNYSGLNLKGDTAWDARVGIPPISIGEVKLLNGFFTRHPKIETEAEEFHLSDYAYSLSAVTKLDEKWSLMIRGQASIRNASEQVAVLNESLFLSLFAMATRPIGESKNWKWSFGLVIPESAVKIPVLPVIGFTYDSPEHDYAVQLSFPVMSFTYFVTENFRIGAMTLFENAAYLLRAGSAYRMEDAKYLGQSRIIVAPFARYRLLKYLSIQTRAGYALKSKTSLEDERYNDVQVIDQKPGVFLQGGIALEI